MAKKSKQSLPPPKGSIPSVIKVSGVDYQCVSVQLRENEFTFKGSDGSIKVKTWAELEKYKLK